MSHARLMDCLRVKDTRRRLRLRRYKAHWRITLFFKRAKSFHPRASRARDTKRPLVLFASCAWIISLSSQTVWLTSHSRLFRFQFLIGELERIEKLLSIGRHGLIRAILCVEEHKHFRLHDIKAHGKA